METNDNNLGDGIATEEDCKQAFDVWSDEGARRFDEMIEEGSVYLAANPHSIDGYKEDFDGEACGYLHSDLYDPEEETLSPGEMEIIFGEFVHLLRSRAAALDAGTTNQPVAVRCAAIASNFPPISIPIRSSRRERKRVSLRQVIAPQICRSDPPPHLTHTLL